MQRAARVGKHREKERKSKKKAREHVAGPGLSQPSTRAPMWLVSPPGSTSPPRYERDKGILDETYIHTAIPSPPALWERQEERQLHSQRSVQSDPTRSAIDSASLSPLRPHHPDSSGRDGPCYRPFAPQGRGGRGREPCSGDISLRWFAGLPSKGNDLLRRGLAAGRPVSHLAVRSVKVACIVVGMVPHG